MDIGKATLSDWKAERSAPNIDKVYRIARLFGVTIEDLLEDTDETGKGA